MYKRHTIYRVAEPIRIDADWDKPVWQAIKPITLELYMGQEPQHRPLTQAKLAWDDRNIYVIFHVQDQFIRAIAAENFDPVYQDSCVEFFFTPQAEVDSGYFNLETNCIGTILMYHQIARGRQNRPLDKNDVNTIQMAASFPKGRPITQEITEPTVWTLEYALPWHMLKHYTDITQPAPGVVWRANFYKCADSTSHPHWLTWSKIPLDQPDFHQPAYFGYLEFVD